MRLPTGMCRVALRAQFTQDRGWASRQGPQFSVGAGSHGHQRYTKLCGDDSKLVMGLTSSFTGVQHALCCMGMRAQYLLQWLSFGNTTGPSHPHGLFPACSAVYAFGDEYKCDGAC